MPQRSRLPSVDKVLNAASVKRVARDRGLAMVKRAVRELQSELRANGDLPDWATDPDGYAAPLEARLTVVLGRGLVRVFNLTGTIIHTNLGRATISRAMAEAGLEAALHPTNLEFDLSVGRRGDRDSLIEPLLCELTGAEAATVVNNNAAAVLLTLNTFGFDRNVPVSRGELIEIGGSFRMPDIMERAGCRVREVGTTNRTHLEDFEAAIDADTGLLIKVHPSNYHIEGFTREVGTRDLAKLAQRHGLPLVVDLGSGALVDLKRFGLPHEPTAAETIAKGADLVTFSGDKLLGAVQAGLIVGKAELIRQIKANPLKRALRVDKITLGILRHTLTLYQEPERLAEELPLIRTLARKPQELEALAQRVSEIFSAHLSADFGVDTTASECQIGSGALPDQRLPSFAVRLRHAKDSALTSLQGKLRDLPMPVIGRLQDGALLFDMRTLDDEAALAENLARLMP